MNSIHKKKAQNQDGIRKKCQVKSRPIDVGFLHGVPVRASTLATHEKKLAVRS